MTELQTSTNRIRLAHKPVGTGLRPFAPGHTCHAWAQQLHGRYLGRPWADSPISRVFRDDELATGQPPVYQQIHIAPRLRLTLVAHTFSQPWPQPAADTPASQWQMIRPSTGQHVEMWVRRLQTQTENRVTDLEQVTQRLVTRLERRCERVEGVAAPGHPWQPRPGSSPLVQPETSRPAAIPAAQPVLRILHRPTAVAPSSPTDSPTRSLNGWEKPTSAPMTAVSAPKTADTVDINRLTEQVVQNLDRRLLAFRERTGRT